MPTCPRCQSTHPTLGAPCDCDPNSRFAADEAISEHPNDPLLGQRVAEKYAIVGVLGEGAMGSVYDARRESDGHRVALKVLKAAGQTQPELRERFFREAQILEKLQHPNLVELYGHGSLDDQGRQLYIAMEHLEGPTLRDLLSHPENIDATRLLTLALDLAEGLGEAHEQGIIHRDLKPANTMIVTGPDGVETLKLLDFGIARLDESKSHLTQTGMVFGTPAYMSPEQCLGETEMGSPTDVYAFGIILYELIGGKRPFEGLQSLVIMMKHANSPVPLLRPRPGLEPLPREVFDLVDQCLEKNPADRPANAGVVADMLRPFVPEERVARPIPVALALVGAGGVAAGGGELATAAQTPSALATHVISSDAEATVITSGALQGSLIKKDSGSGKRVWLIAALLLIVGVGGALLLGTGDGPSKGSTAEAEVSANATQPSKTGFVAPRLPGQEKTSDAEHKEQDPGKSATTAGSGTNQDATQKTPTAKSNAAPSETKEKQVSEKERKKRDKELEKERKKRDKELEKQRKNWDKGKKKKGRKGKKHHGR